jgi:hypothetical protein
MSWIAEGSCPVDQALFLRSSYWVLLTLEVTEFADFQNIWQACSAAVLAYSHSSLGTVLNECGKENLIYILSVACV